MAPATGTPARHPKKRERVKDLQPRKVWTGYFTPPENGVRFSSKELVIQLQKIPSDLRGARAKAIVAWREKGYVVHATKHCLNLLRQYEMDGHVR